MSTEIVAYVLFINVGRSKKTWTQEFHQSVTESVLESAVRKSRALMSRDIACLINDDRTGGVIFAGAHCVGSFEFSAA